METSANEPSPRPSSLGSRASSARLRRRARSAARERREETATTDKNTDKQRTSRTRVSLQQTTRTAVRLEDDWNVATLQELRSCFGASQNQRLNEEQFVAALRPHVASGNADGYLRNLLYKIQDTGSSITWDEFATYMILEYQKKNDAYTKSKKVPIRCPATSSLLPHRSPVARIRKGPKDNIYVLNENATISIWAPGSHGDTCSQKIPLKMATGTRKWVTDFALLRTIGKLAVASGERELWVFDLKTMEPAFVLTHLEDTPMRVESLLNPETRASSVVIGDHAGSMCSISFPQFCFTAKAFKDSQRQGKLNKIVLRIPLDKLASASEYYGGISYTRWAVHNDWVSDLLYLPSLRMLVSTSNEEDTAMVVGEIIRPTLYQPKTLDIDPKGPSAHLFSSGTGLRRNPNERVFKIHKGAKSVAFSERNNLLITGGLDRHLRLWNPHVNHRPSGVLKGHNSPIARVLVQDSMDRVFSLSTDLELKIWDILDTSCLATVSRRKHAIHIEPSYAYFDESASTIILTTESYHTLSLQEQASGNSKTAAKTHSTAIVSVVHNARFKHLITVDAHGTVKAWDSTTGTAAFEFDVKDGADDPSNVTDAFLDTSNRRLITTQTSGYTRAWNYNNGQLLRTFNKGTSKEVVAGVYVQQGTYKQIVIGGWDNRLYVFKDSPEDDLSLAPSLPIRTRWVDAESHQDNIVCLAVCPPNLLASASYDGQIFLWNLSSASVFCRLTPTSQKPKRISMRASCGNMMIDAMLEEASSTALVFLPRRAVEVGTAGFVAGSSVGDVSFWSFAKSGSLLARFSLNAERSGISAMTVTEDNDTLVVANSQGWIYVFDLRDYEQGRTTKKTVHFDVQTTHLEMSRQPPLILSHWRAHLSRVHRVALVTIHDVQVLLSSSEDGCCRLWDMQGSFIATLGQEVQFDVGRATTWEHPKRPSEIVALEEEEEQARLANETLLQEMFDLGIYDDNDDSPANDLDSVAGDSRAGSRFTSAARSRSGTYRPMTSTLLSTIPASPASSRSASPSPRSLSPAAHSPRRNPRRTSVFELRRLPKQVAGPAKGITDSPPQRRRESVALSKHLEPMRRIQSAPAIQRLVERGASPVGNWARHLSSQPHRYTKEKVYQTLPYHNLGPVTKPSRQPVVEDELFRL